MPETLMDSQAPPLDPSRAVLDLIHRLLIVPAAEQTDWSGLLDGLLAAFRASGAGLAIFPEGVPLCIRPAPAHESLTEDALPWREHADASERLLPTDSALTLPRSAGGSFLVTVLGTPERGGWLLWLEDRDRTQWNATEGSLLTLLGHALTHRLTQEEPRTGWPAQLDQALRRQQMETAARLVRRLAHDFGNVLTGILGFSELALAQQLSPSSPLHSFLSEINRGAQNGAQLTNQLRLFARRQTASTRSCQVAAVLAEEEKRLQPLLGAGVQLQLQLPDRLPAVALDAESLKQALASVLDNAREAITGTGIIEVSARLVQLSAGEARQLLGNVRAGMHLEIRVADSGSGLSAEARRQLFREPFFSTKPRKRGFSLAMTYGLLSAHHGGLELLSRPEGGTIARLLLPAVAVAVSSEPGAPADGPARSLAAQRSSESAPPKDRILVVDDDPMILQLIATTLERAGYRVQTVTSAEEALKIYRGSAGDPFRLVLSDVLMPDVNGIDLVRRLLVHDAKVSVLFMSGQVPAEILHQTFGAGRFELLAKPFRSEGLIYAVRAAIERAAAQKRKAANGMPQEQIAIPHSDKCIP